MKDDLARLVEAIDAGRISRRSFLNRTAAFGLTAALGTSLLPTGARADEYDAVDADLDAFEALLATNHARRADAVLIGDELRNAIALVRSPP